MPVSRETYERVMSIHGYCCAQCGSNQDVQLHHIKHNHKNNREKWPNFIDSEHNLVALCGLLSNNCHEKKKHFYKITDEQAQEFEDNLKEK